jgi:hypothetical protein
MCLSFTLVGKTSSIKESTEYGPMKYAKRRDSLDEIILTSTLISFRHYIQIGSEASQSWGRPSADSFPGSNATKA